MLTENGRMDIFMVGQYIIFWFRRVVWGIVWGMSLIKLIGRGGLGREVSNIRKRMIDGLIEEGTRSRTLLASLGGRRGERKVSGE